MGIMEKVAGVSQLLLYAQFSNDKLHLINL